MTMERWKQRFRDPIFLGGLASFVVSQIGYLLTLTLSCPFWDSGEFIATSYVLGIPHPPGTPLYVLIGRLFTLAPIGQIATRVNYLSALASSLAVVFTYLVIVNMARRLRRGSATWLDEWITAGGALAGAFFMAFSRTFWDNAIEAEVYAISSLVVVLAVWFSLKWEESGRGAGGRRDDNLLLLVIYLLFVSVGFHMGTLLVAPAVLLFVLLVAAPTVLNRDVLTTSAWVGASAVAFLLFKAIGLPVGLALVLAALGFAAMVGWKWERLGRRNLAFWALALAVAGLTVQFFLLIRAHHNPPINEADPDNWKAFWLVLSRDQYKPVDPFITRKASWAIQFGKHFWRYWRDQYDLGVRPEWFSMMFPFLLGLVGAVLQAWRDARRFLFVAALLFFTTLFLVFYLNFPQDEVRDRDYFFVTGFHFFTLWIGLGAVVVARWLRGEGRPVTAREPVPAQAATPAPATALRRPARLDNFFGLGTAAILVILSLFPARHGWFEHDRTHFQVARDYAYNMLVALEPNAVVFTNGDNDTFPLWYLQEVEKIRRDVRVVNLSLLNTPWYIRQIRDYEPRVRVTIPDREIDELRGVMLPSGKVVYVKDVMVHHIIEENPDRPVYVAVTVPELMDLDKRLVMEGLVFRVVPEEGEPERIDVAKTWKNLREVYRYPSLLDAQGNYDDSVYKDGTARKLVQNYVAAYVKIAHDALKRNDEAQAMEALDYARGISPNFPGVLYTLGYLWMQKSEYGRAEQAFRQMIGSGDTSAEAYQLLGASLEAQGRLADAEDAYRQAVQLHPDDFDATRVLFTLLWDQAERRDQAVQVIEDWLRRHPSDTATRAALQRLMESDSSGAPASQAAPAPGRQAGR
jgi:Flp pilus assembly protein TadD